METYESLLAAVTVDDGFDVEDPATNQVIGKAPDGTPADLEKAIDAAEKAQKEWARRSDAERTEVLLKVADLIEENAEALAQIISHEQGKALDGPGARFEVQAILGWLRTAATLEIEPEVTLDEGGLKATVYYKPLGVIGAINPWNWPAMIATWQFAPALRMGNAIVMKPSEYTPLSVLATAHLVNQVLPEGLLQVVSGGRELGAAFSSNPRFDRLTFTGSVATGKAIARSAADHLAPVTLELGGNDAGIVLPSADPKAIAEGVFWGAFLNTGQTCAALKRLYVHESQYDEMVDALAAVVGAIPVGPGYEEGSLLGPLTTKQQFGIVDDLVEDAKERGARIVVGGEPDRDAPGYFYPTTLVADIDNDAPLVQTEQFGPALPIIKYSSVEEAIEMANNIDVGLGGSVWGPQDEAREVALQIEAGSVWINQHGAVNPKAPFGGVKQSGYGSEFSVEGLREMGRPLVLHDTPQQG